MMKSEKEGVIKIEEEGKNDDFLYLILDFKDVLLSCVYNKYFQREHVKSLS